jgi:trimeric autotransporter adhesin
VLKNLFIVFFLQISLTGYGQALSFCQIDSLVSFSVVPSNPSNSLQWEFIQGAGALIVQGQNSDSVKVRFSSSGNFVLQLTETALGGCSNSVFTDIKVRPSPKVSFDFNEACIGNEILFVNTSVYENEIVSCNWSLFDFNQNINNLPYTFNQSGTFPVTLSMMNEFGCSESTTKMVTVSEMPIADFYFNSEDISILNSSVEFINLSDDGEMTWDFGDGQFSNESDPIHNFETAGWQEITLTLENLSGCIDTLTKELLVESRMVLFLPNAFTPDGDNINDVFGPSGLSMERLTSFRFEVMNKWGQIIFETDDKDKSWDGNLASGQSAMINTYTWNLVVKDELGKTHRRFGTVDLLK